MGMDNKEGIDWERGVGWVGGKLEKNEITVIEETIKGRKK